MRIEDALDSDLLQDRLGAADVVALRVGEDERRQASNAERLQLLPDVALRRALVDEDGSLRNLHENGVTLADVEERDPQPGRRRQGRRRQQLPRDQRRQERGGTRERRRSPPRRQPPQAEQQERRAEQHAHRRS